MSLACAVYPDELRVFKKRNSIKVSARKSHVSD